jgi:hypothetical protein
VILHCADWYVVTAVSRDRSAYNGLWRRGPEDLILSTTAVGTSNLACFPIMIVRNSLYQNKFARKVIDLNEVAYCVLFFFSNDLPFPILAGKVIFIWKFVDPPRPSAKSAA